MKVLKLADLPGVTVTLTRGETDYELQMRVISKKAIEEVRQRIKLPEPPLDENGKPDTEDKEFVRKTRDAEQERGWWSFYMMLGNGFFPDTMTDPLEAINILKENFTELEMVKVINAGMGTTALMREAARKSLAPFA